jgi:hypothetical protein
MITNQMLILIQFKAVEVPDGLDGGLGIGWTSTANIGVAKIIRTRRTVNT